MFFLSFMNKSYELDIWFLNLMNMTYLLFTTFLSIGGFPGDQVESGGSWDKSRQATRRDLSETFGIMSSDAEDLAVGKKLEKEVGVWRGEGLRVL